VPAFVVGPAALVVATVVHPPHGGDAESWFGAAVGNPTRFYLAHILFLVGTLLLLPAVFTLFLRLALWRPRLAVLGAGLSVAGGFGVASLVGIDLVVWQMARPHPVPGDMLALLQAVSGEPGVVLPLYGLTGTLGLGFALLLGGLERAGVVPRACTAITVGGFGLWAAGLPVAPLAIAGTVLLLIGLARAGLGFDPRPVGESRLNVARSEGAMIVMFADLAGYTALTDVHGDEEAVAAVEAFHQVVSQAAEAGHLNIIKGIGDAFLLTGADAAGAVAAARDVIEAMQRVERAPAVRVGIHAGPVSLRGGDVFGGTVNIAARVAGEARAGQILVTQEVLASAGAGRASTHP
jgi:hypothetical protein